MDYIAGVKGFNYDKFDYKYGDRIPESVLEELKDSIPSMIRNNRIQPYYASFSSVQFVEKLAHDALVDNRDLGMRLNKRLNELEYKLKEAEKRITELEKKPKRKPQVRKAKPKKDKK